MREIFTRREFFRLPFAFLSNKEERDNQQDKRLDDHDNQIANLKLTDDYLYKTAMDTAIKVECQNARIGRLEIVVFPEPDPNPPEIVPRGEPREV
jgi:hypothetical protein